MSSPRIRSLVVVIGALLALPALLPSRPAAASIVVAMDLPALVKQADHIAVVDVVSTSADWDAKHERIFTTVELKVVERWKGAPVAGAEDHLRIVQPGGTVGDLTMTVTGLSTFSPGERALVFLRGTANNARVLGLGQGKRPMRQESTSGKWMVSRPTMREATLVKPRADHSGATAPSVSPTNLKQSTGTVGNSSSTGGVTPAADSTRDRGLDEMRAEVKSLMGVATP
jgi:hypothetical protein